MAVADLSTYVKMDRNLRFWRWFKSPKTVVVWIWLIMSANIEDHDFERETIHRGEVATSRKTISAATGLTENEVRTALDHLKSTGEITSRTRPKYQVITILRYSDYQDVPTGKRPGRAPANHRQTTGRPPQSKNGKNGKNEKNEKDSSRDTTTTIRVPPLREDVDAFCMENGISTDIDAFMSYNAARGWMRGKAKIRDWHPLLMQWISKDSEFGHDPENKDDDGLDDFGQPIRKEFK
jgi:hypothetical protein